MGLTFRDAGAITCLIFLQSCSVVTAKWTPHSKKSKPFVKEWCPDFEDEHCPMWAARGKCETNPSWMWIQCPSACGRCEPRPIVDPCQDYHEGCHGWAMHGKCHSRHDQAFMNTVCPMSCHKCIPGHAMHPTHMSSCSDKTPACSDWVEAKPWRCSSDPEFGQMCKSSCKMCQAETCVDEDDMCAMWAKNGECDLMSDNPESYLMKHCKKSCNVCGISFPEPEPQVEDLNCRDKSSHCKAWAEEGQCELMMHVPESWIMRNCQKTCHVCVPGASAPALTPECGDEHEKCGRWASMGKCNRKSVKMQCQKSCNSCGLLISTTVHRGSSSFSSSSSHSTFESSSFSSSSSSSSSSWRGGSSGSSGSWGSSSSGSGRWGSSGGSSRAGSSRGGSSRGGSSSSSTSWEGSTSSSSSKEHVHKTGMPKPAPMCRDDNNGCHFLIKHKTCAVHWIKEVCQKSCGACGCMDKEKDCAFLAEHGMCEIEQEVRDMCPGSCKTCDIKPEGELPEPEPETPENPETENPEQPENVCEDKHEGCQPMAVRGNCETVPEMLIDCPLACNVCTPEETSVDTDSSSDTSSETPGETPSEKPSETPGETPSETPGETPSETSGETPSETPGEIPPETENPEQPENVCRDKHEGCEPKALRGECETDSDMLTDCPLACNVCTPEETSVDTDSPSDTPSETPGETPSETPSETPGETPPETPSDAPSTPSEPPSETPGETPFDPESETPSETPGATESEDTSSETPGIPDDTNVNSPPPTVAPPPTAALAPSIASATPSEVPGTVEDIDGLN